MMGDPSLELIEVSKSYGDKRALDEVTLRLGAGMLGLLGPNGAGKSTLLSIAATASHPTTGQVRFGGHDVRQDPDLLRRTLGYLPQDFGVYPHLTGREFLSFLAAAKGLPARVARTRIDELLELVNLSQDARRALSGYSGGMLRRIGIAQALLNDPQVIIVDEPTAGLDPEERMRFRHLLSDLALDRVVVLSTHIVSDIEAVASDIAVLAAGKLLRRGSPVELLREVDGRAWELSVDPSDVPELQRRLLVSRMAHSADGVRLRVVADDRPRADASPVAPDLEDAYLALLAEPTTPSAVSGQHQSRSVR